MSISDNSVYCCYSHRHCRCCCHHQHHHYYLHLLLLFFLLLLLELLLLHPIIIVLSTKEPWKTTYLFTHCLTSKHSEKNKNATVIYSQHRIPHDHKTPIELINRSYLKHSCMMSFNYWLSWNILAASIPSCYIVVAFHNPWILQWWLHISEGIS